MHASWRLQSTSHPATHCHYGFPVPVAVTGVRAAMLGRASHREQPSEGSGQGPGLDRLGSGNTGTPLDERGGDGSGGMGDGRRVSPPAGDDDNNRSSTEASGLDHQPYPMWLKVSIHEDGIFGNAAVKAPLSILLSYHLA